MQNCVFLENRWTSLYCRSKSFKIDETRCTLARVSCNIDEHLCTVVGNNENPMNIVALSCLFIQTRWTFLFQHVAPSTQDLSLGKDAAKGRSLRACTSWGTWGTRPCDAYWPWSFEYLAASAAKYCLKSTSEQAGVGLRRENAGFPGSKKMKPWF